VTSAGEGFHAALRLRRRREFVRVQGQGEKHHVRHFLVFVARQPREATQERLPPARLGVTVTRKVGGAVVRNRIKRWVREAFRRSQRDWPGGLDMVWVAKQNAASADFAGVDGDMRQMASRLAVWKVSP
jgi:ribonuclease P protein component